MIFYICYFYLIYYFVKSWIFICGGFLIGLEIVSVLVYDLKGWYNVSYILYLSLNIYLNIEIL